MLKTSASHAYLLTLNYIQKNSKAMLKQIPTAWQLRSDEI